MTYANAVKAFVEEKMETFPYSEVPHTRRGFYPKWLLAMTGSTRGIFGRKHGYYVIKSSCLNHDNLQMLIMDGDGVPLPPDFCEVVDTLETWGATRYSLWLQKALFVMHGHVAEDNMYGNIAPNKLKLFYDCILPMVGYRAGQHFGRNGTRYNRVLTSWITYFWVRCRETCAFRDLATNSWWFVDGLVETINAERARALTADVSVDVVPQSPTSSDE